MVSDVDGELPTQHDSTIYLKSATCSNSNSHTSMMLFVKPK